MSNHAILSPSAAKRWLTCTRAPRLEAQFENKTSVYAQEGTLAHEVAALTVEYYLGRVTDDEFEFRLEKLSKDELYSNEMKFHAEEYASIIMDKVKNLINPDVIVETKVDISMYAPECFGTADCIIISDGVLEVIDYKYGQGVEVSAKDNPQMKLYALGAIEKYYLLYDFDAVKMTIVQPRKNGISEDSLTVIQLLDWGNLTVRPKAIQAFEGKGRFYPDPEACRFCRASAVCSARAKKNLGIAKFKSDTMTHDELGQVLAKAKDLAQWIKDMETEVFEALQTGEEIKGWKLVRGRSLRKYTDDSKVIERLRESNRLEEDIFDTKLKSVSALEKAIGKKEVAELIGDLIEKPEGAPTLAPEDDKREAINVKETLLKVFDEK